jgi:poly(hydroxyalkanoate) depolymerase family esterase
MTVMILRVSLLLIGTLVFSLALIPRGQAASLTEITDFGSNPGHLRVFVYRPDKLPINAPLLVTLHGCKQTAGDYDDESGWTQYADRWGFLLLLPQQQQTNNGMACFNWFRPDDTRRDQGEALSIRQMVDYAKSHYPVDPDRIYITGLSAGGAMTAALLAAYPDIFAGGAIVAGIPYGCASGYLSALWCQLWGRDLDPMQWGDRVRQAAQSAGIAVKQWPRVSIWQGSADPWVKQGNADELMEQWTNVHGIDQQPEVEDSVNGYPHRVYQDATGQAQVETYLITGLRHGQPIDPGAGVEHCGVPADYILTAGICASYYIARFFHLDAPVSPPSAAAPRQTH